MTDIALILSPLAFWLLFAVVSVMRDHVRNRSAVAHRLQVAIGQRDKYSPAEAAYWNGKRWD